MTYFQTFPPDKFEDGDVLIGCNCARRTVDFDHKKVTVRDTNCSNMIPLNDENVTVIDSPAYGAPIVDIETETVDPVDVEIKQIVERMAELSYAYPEKTSARLKATVDLATIEGLLSADGKGVTVKEELP